MAFFKFTRAMLANQPIDIYNYGKMQRDFTYIDDIVEGLMRVLAKPPAANPDFDTMRPDPAISNCPYHIFNIGNHCPTQLMDYINHLEEALGLEAKKNFLPMQPGDVHATTADVEALHEWVGFKPNTPVPIGIQRFVEWYRSYYHL